MPASNKFMQLLDTLLTRTKRGKARWTPGSRDDTFIWSGSSASVAVLTRDNDGAPPWMVRIIDDDGRTIEEEMFLPNETGYDLVSELYNVARADALDITAAIESLLGDLQD